MDPFTIKRLTSFIETFKAKNGRDASAKEVEQQGFSKELLKKLVQKGLLKKHQVTTQSGSTENRYKLAKNWKSINLI